MRRREFVETVAGGAACLLPGCRSLSVSSRAGRKPNIILLVTDDQRWDTLGCMGNPIIKTPNIDDMAREGVLFKNAYVTTSICCASRASIFAGQYARRTGIHDFKTAFSDEALSQTYPTLLRDAGYRIGFIGKYGVGKKNLPEEKFDVWHGFPGQGRYEHQDETGKYKHLTRIMGDQAREFLAGCSKEQPFCLSVSFKAAHVQDNDPRQFIHDPAYDHLYRDDVIPTPKTAAPEYFESFPEFFKRDNEGRRRWEIRFSTPEQYQKMVKNHYRLITGVDTVVGEIRDTLEQRGFEDNTIIMFTGDNGFYLGEHGLAGKWWGHEESIRVPLVIYDPRLSARNRGQKREEMALNIDIAPTILSMAGLPAPASMQGRDLMTLVHGTAGKWRQDFFYEHLFDHPRIPKSEGVVSKRFKYLCYFDQNPVYEELYDLKTDPYEETNLATDAGYRGVLEKLRRRCAVLRKAAR